MRNTTVKCPRCGKVHTLTLKTADEVFECTHCHKKMVLTKKSDTMRMVCGYIVSMAIVTVLMLIMTPLASSSNGIYLISVMLGGLIIGMFMSKYTVKIAFILFGLNYRDIEEAKAEEAAKQAKKNKKK